MKPGEAEEGPVRLRRGGEAGRRCSRVAKPLLRTTGFFVTLPAATRRKWRWSGMVMKQSRPEFEVQMAGGGRDAGKGIKEQ
ncbi:unnamed protein product [Chondrus crispus]|uniref:Uncharacterized protein n=1 Tax=Chondrus crispus TaxID=2769 RepID=R7Q8Y6_CHOCR|nr:unnamed protein product [Chondrus crispus]CDF34494.1 unnamed protein product [Chondrus crispus]|eukprot:XP_005714313.1 unnamed protein product [Chondrus crispus]